MSEYIVPDPIQPLMQGDILLSRDIKTGEIKNTLFVITADCDISNKKYGEYIACLKIIGLNKYIGTFWAEKKLKNSISREFQKNYDKVVSFHKEIIGGGSNLTEDAVFSWIKRESPSEICEELNVPERERKSFIANLSIFKKALLSISDVGDASDFDKYLTFESIVKNLSIEDILRNTLNNLKRETFPNDVFLVTSLPQVDYGPAVVLLRDIIGIRANDIYFRAVDANESNSYIRIGRTKDTFKHAISQAFGTLFSRIGLPEDYEDRVEKIKGELNYEGLKKC